MRTPHLSSSHPYRLRWRQILGSHRWALALVAGGAFLLTGLPASGSAATSSPVSVSATGPVRSITPTLFGINGFDSTGPPYNNTKLVTAITRFFGAGALRYPGGTAANYWAWRQGWFQPGQWPAEPRRQIDDKIGVYTGALNASGAIPQFIPNVLTYQGKIGTNA